MGHKSRSTAQVSAGRRQRQRGSTFVEFGLVMVPTFGLIFLALNLAWILFGWACLQEAVREGVRYGITGPVNSGLDASIKNFVTQMSMGFINTVNSPNIQVQYFSHTTLTQVTGQAGATDAGNVLKVTATISMKALVPVWKANGTPLGTFTAWTITLAAASADVLETSQTPPSET